VVRDLFELPIDLMLGVECVFAGRGGDLRFTECRQKAMPLAPMDDTALTGVSTIALLIYFIRMV
jgi:hypothetical protein